MQDNGETTQRKTSGGGQKNRLKKLENLSVEEHNEELTNKLLNCLEKLHQKSKSK